MLFSECSVRKTRKFAGVIQDVKLKSRAGYARMMEIGRGIAVWCSKIRMMIVVQMLPPLPSQCGRTLHWSRTYAESPVNTTPNRPLFIPMQRPFVSCIVRYASKPSSIAQGYGSAISLGYAITTHTPVLCHSQYPVQAFLCVWPIFAVSLRDSLVPLQ